MRTWRPTAHGRPPTILSAHARFLCFSVDLLHPSYELPKRSCGSRLATKSSAAIWEEDQHLPALLSAQQGPAFRDYRRIRIQTEAMHFLLSPSYNDAVSSPAPT